MRDLRVFALLLSLFPAACTYETYEAPADDSADVAATSQSGEYSGAFPSAADERVLVLEAKGLSGIQTITLSRDFEGFQPNADAHAVIEYGVGDVESSFECDWVHGTQLSLAADWVRVSFETYAPMSGSDYTADGDVTFGASVAAGATSHLPATYTEPQLFLQALTVRRFPVPAFAKSVTLYMGNGPEDYTSGLRFTFETPWNTLAYYDGPQLLANIDGFQVPGGATEVSIGNDDQAQPGAVGGGSRGFTLVWTLGL